MDNFARYKVHGIEAEGSQWRLRVHSGPAAFHDTKLDGAAAAAPTATSPPKEGGPGLLFDAVGREGHHHTYPALGDLGLGLLFSGKFHSVFDCTPLWHWRRGGSTLTSGPLFISLLSTLLALAFSLFEVMLTDVSSAFGEWHRASAGVPEALAVRVRSRVRVPLFSCMVRPRHRWHLAPGLRPGGHWERGGAVESRYRGVGRGASALRCIAVFIWALLSFLFLFNHGGGDGGCGHIVCAGCIRAAPRAIAGRDHGRGLAHSVVRRSITGDQCPITPGFRGREARGGGGGGRGVKKGWGETLDCGER